MGLDPTMVKVPRTAGVLWDCTKPLVVIQLLLVIQDQEQNGQRDKYACDEMPH